MRLASDKIIMDYQQAARISDCLIKAFQSGKAAENTNNSLLYTEAGEKGFYFFQGITGRVILASVDRSADPEEIIDNLAAYRDHYIKTASEIIGHSERNASTKSHLASTSAGLSAAADYLRQSQTALYFPCH